MTVTQSRLKELLYYDEFTGYFTWIKSNGKKIKPGMRAGYAWLNKHNGKRYIQLQVDGKLYYAHRLAFVWMTGIMPIEVDHSDGNGWNNKWSNLRSVTHQQNLKNIRLSDNNTTGCTGVHLNKSSKKYEAYINNQGKKIHLGLFDNMEDAKTTRRRAEKELAFHKNHGSVRPL